MKKIPQSSAIAFGRLLSAPFILSLCLCAVVLPATLRADFVVSGTSTSILGVSGTNIVVTGLLPGDTGVLVTAGNNSYAYTDHASVIRGIGDSMAANGIVIHPATAGGWALLEMGNTTAERFIYVSAPTTLPLPSFTIDLDRTILAGGHPNSDGGAINFATGIGNYATVATIHGDVMFYNNVAAGSSSGGAIYAQNLSMLFDGKVIFESNSGGAAFTGTSTGESGGAIRSNTPNGTFTFQKEVDFINNLAGGEGGAIGVRSQGGQVYTFQDTAVFTGNVAGFSTMNNARHGGAIGVDIGSTAGLVTSLIFNGTAIFTSNTAGGNGGAICFANGSQYNKLAFNGDSVFTGNRSVNGTYGGGAISIQSTYDTLSFLGNTAFVSNTASIGQGGAILIIASAVTSATTDILDIKKDALFQGNYAYTNGGAIVAGSNANGQNKIVIATGTGSKDGIRFINNVAATGNGGAIYFNSYAGGTLALSAQNADILFTGNVTGTGANRAPNDIYIASNSLTIALDASAGRTVYLNDGIKNGASNNDTIIKTGSGAVVFGTNANGQNVSDLAASTTVTMGEFRLEGGSVYGRATTSGTFVLQSGATLDGSGTVRVNNMTIAAGSTLRVISGGQLALAATTFANTGTINVAGNGIINTGAFALNAGRVSIGDLNHTTAQTLMLTGAVNLSNATIQLGIFGNANDNLIVSSATLAYGATTFDFTNLLSGTYTLISGTGAAGVAALGSGTYLTTIAGKNNARVQTTYTTTATSVLVGIQKTNAVRTWTGLAVPANATWNMSDVNWAEGDQTFLAGDIAVFGNTTSGTIAVAPTGAFASGMSVNSSSNYIFTGGIITTDSASYSGPANYAANGKLTKDGTGTLTFSNSANVFKQGIALNAGVIAFSSSAQLGTVDTVTGSDSGITFAGSGTLQPNANDITLNNLITIAAGQTGVINTGTNTLTYTGALNAGGAGATLSKIGAGTLVVTNAANSSYTGTMAVNQGMLLLANTAQLGGAITIVSGGTLAGTGAATGSVTANAGSVINIGTPGSMTGETITLGALSLNNATVDYDTFSTTSYDKINATSLSLSGTNTLNFCGGIANGTYTLINCAALFTGGTQNLITMIDGVAPSLRTTINYTFSAGTLNMTAFTGNYAMTWNGVISSTWNTIDANWNTADGRFASGDIVIFNSVADAAHTNNRNITVAIGNASIASGTVLGSGTYTFIGGAIVSGTDASRTSYTNADGRFTMAGTGKVIFANDTNNIIGGIYINSGAVQGTIVSLGTNTINITSTTATLAFDVSQSGTYLGKINGLGIISLVNGPGTAASTGTFINPGVINATTFTQDAGNLAFTASGTLNAATYNQNTGAVTLNTGALNATTYNLNNGLIALRGGAFAANTFNLAATGTLAGTGAFKASTLNNSGVILVGKAAGVSSAYGTLTLNGDYIGKSGLIVLSATLNAGGPASHADQFVINGNASGNSLVHINNNNQIIKSGTVSSVITGTATGSGLTDGIKVIGIKGNNNATFALDQRVVAGIYDYGLVAGTGGMYLQAVTPSPEIPAATALPAMALYMGQTALDSVQTRMGEIRFAREYEKGGWWLRYTYNDTELQQDIFTGARVGTNVFQAGYDRQFRDGFGGANWSLGAYFTYTDGTGKTRALSDDIGRGLQQGGTISNLADGLGIYALMQKGAWYFDGTLKADRNNFTISAGNDNFSSRSWNWSGAFETGYSCPTKYLGIFEPQAQVSYQTYNFDYTKDYYKRGYSYDPADSLLGRMGVRWRGSLVFSDKSWLMPWIRVGAAHEFLSDYQIRVKDASGTIQRYQNDMRGDNFIVDGGFTWGPTDQFCIYASGAYTTGDTSKDFTLSAGVRYIW